MNKSFINFVVTVLFFACLIYLFRSNNTENVMQEVMQEAYGVDISKKKSGDSLK